MGRHRVVHTCCIEETVWLDIRLLRAWGFLEADAITSGVVNWRTRGVDRHGVSGDVRALTITQPFRAFGTQLVPSRDRALSRLRSARRN